MPVPPPPNAKMMFHGAVMDFWQWEQRMYDGSMATFDCVTRQDTATVIPFIDSRTVILAKQEQPQKTHPFFDFPGGRIDAGETHEEAVRRELAEETGYRAKRWTEWHRLKNNGQLRFEESLHLATDLENGLDVHLDSGEKIELIPTSWSNLIQMCLKRQLRQPNIMLAILEMEFDPESKQRLHDWLRG